MDGRTACDEGMRTTPGSEEQCGDESDTSTSAPASGATSEGNTDGEYYRHSVWLLRSIY